MVRTCIEEHITNRSRLFVDLERMSGEDNPFGDDACRIWVQEAAHRNQLRRFIND